MRKAIGRANRSSRQSRAGDGDDAAAEQMLNIGGAAKRAATTNSCRRRLGDKNSAAVSRSQSAESIQGEKYAPSIDTSLGRRKDQGAAPVANATPTSARERKRRQKEKRRHVLRAIDLSKVNVRHEHSFRLIGPEPQPQASLSRSYASAAVLSKA